MHFEVYAFGNPLVCIKSVDMKVSDVLDLRFYFKEFMGGPQFPLVFLAAGSTFLFSINL
jgi:hypothetical protein